MKTPTTPLPPQIQGDRRFAKPTIPQAESAAFPRLCIAFLLAVWLLLNTGLAQSVKLKLDQNDYVTSGFFTQANCDFMLTGINTNAGVGSVWNWNRVSKTGSALMDIEGRTTLTLATSAAQTYLLSLDGSGSFAGSLLRARRDGTDVFTVSTTGVVATTGQFTGSGAGLTGVSLTTSVTGTLPVANGGTGITALGAGVQNFWGTPTSANLALAVTNETGSGALVFATSPTLITPALGTPSSVVLTNGTLLPLTTGVTGTLPAANGGTGITSLGAGVQTFWGTPSSANLAAAVTNETGSGALVFATSPTFTTPVLGTPSSVVLTNGTLLPLTTGVTGTLPVANGGTGATTVAAAQTALSVPGFSASQTLTAAQMQLLAMNSGAVDPKLVIIREDFLGGTLSSGNIGENGLTGYVQSGALSFSVNQGAYPNLGQCKLITGAATGNGGAVSLDYGNDNGNPFPDIAQPGWDICFIVGLAQTTDCVARIGLINSHAYAYNAAPGRGLYLRFSTALGDTQWMYVSNVSGTETATASGVTASTAFVKMRVRMTTANAALFSINGGAETSISTAIVGSAAPRCMFYTETTVAKTMYWDFLGILATTSR